MPKSWQQNIRWKKKFCFIYSIQYENSNAKELVAEHILNIRNCKIQAEETTWEKSKFNISATRKNGEIITHKILRFDIVKQ